MSDLEDGDELTEMVPSVGAKDVLSTKEIQQVIGVCLFLLFLL
jgi:hypothetical protein